MVVTALERRIAVSLGRVVERLPPDVVGLALMTDDDLITVAALWCRRNQVSSGDDDFLFMPTDWDDAADLACDAELRELRQTSRGQEIAYDRQVRLLVSACEGALLQVKRDVERLSDAFMTVLSGGGGGIWTEEESRVVLSLNGAAPHRRWCEVMGVEWSGR